MDLFMGIYVQIIAKQYQNGALWDTSYSLLLIPKSGVFGTLRK
jgi:hypothetical protein